MIVEKKGKTTIYKCGKKYDKPESKPKKKTGKYTMAEIDEIADSKTETVTEPESIPDKKNKKKTLKEG